jgi:uncharacterized protein YbjT (DUF2867 family)
MLRSVARHGSAGTVLVAGATGRVGKAVVAHLAKSGKFTIRATSSNPENYEALKKLGAHECVNFDLKDPSSWGEVTKGVTHVYTASVDPLIKEHMAFAKHLGSIKGQIKHVVRISCFGADTNTNSYDPAMHCSVEGQEIPMMLQHYWWSEKCLIDEGLPVTGVRGNFYMNHVLKNDQDNIKEKGFFEQPAAKCANSFVSPNDMGEVAAICLIEGPEKHADKFYDITGPKPITHYEMAATLSEVMGKKVEYKEQDPVQWEKDFGATRAAFREYLRNGFYSRCSPSFYNLTGRKPTTYKDYLTQVGVTGITGLEELFSSAGKLYTKGVDPFKKLAAEGKK